MQKFFCFSNILCWAACVFILTACGPNYAYKRPDGMSAEEAQRDAAKCLMMMDMRSSTTVNVNVTTTPMNGWQNLSNGFQQAGDSFGNIAAAQSFKDNCMRSYGFTKVIVSEGQAITRVGD